MITAQRKVIIEGILAISRQLLESMSDATLKATMRRAWQTENEDQDNPVEMDEIGNGVFWMN